MARVLGVNLAAGVAYLALVEPPQALKLDEVVKVVPAESLAGVVRLQDFGDRFVQQARGVAATHVVVAEPRPRPSPWSYADAHARVELETTILLLATKAGIASATMKQTEAAKAVGVSELKEVSSTLKKLVSEKVKHWEDRVPALLVALATAKVLA